MRAELPVCLLLSELFVCLLFVLFVVFFSLVVFPVWTLHQFMQFLKLDYNFRWICESHTPKQFNLGFQARQEAHTCAISVVRESPC